MVVKVVRRQSPRAPSVGLETLSCRIRDLYVDKGLSTYAIGRALGIDRQRIARFLRRAGAELSPRGAGRPRGEGRALLSSVSRDLLSDLYTRDRRSTDEIGALFNISGNTVQRILRAHAIRLRTTGSVNREDRKTLPVDVVKGLYLRDGLSAAEIGKRFGCSSRIVLRLIHDMGWPRRGGGPALHNGPADIELIRALYDDALVASTLRRHGFPRVAPGGPIWQRFPVPIDVTPQMVHDLYLTCGLSTRQIELLTGQPADTIVHRLRLLGVPVRSKSARSPFLKRWHAGVTAGIDEHSRRIRVR